MTKDQAMREIEKILKAERDRESGLRMRRAVELLAYAICLAAVALVLAQHFK